MDHLTMTYKDIGHCELGLPTLPFVPSPSPGFQRHLYLVADSDGSSDSPSCPSLSPSMPTTTTTTRATTTTRTTATTTSVNFDPCMLPVLHHPSNDFVADFAVGRSVIREGTSHWVMWIKSMALWVETKIPKSMLLCAGYIFFVW